MKAKTGKQKGIKLTKAAKDLGMEILKSQGKELQGKTFVTFDVSTQGTGWSHWKIKKNGEVTYLDGGVINPKGKKAKDRFPKMANGIINVISGKMPSFIVSERMFIRKSFDSIEYPLKLHGIEEYAASIAGIPDVPIVTTTWRNLCGFLNNLEIGTDQQMTQKEKDKYYKLTSMRLAGALAGFEITDDNHADAICIGLAISKILQYYMQNAQNEEKKNK